MTGNNDKQHFFFIVTVVQLVHKRTSDTTTQSERYILSSATKNIHPFHVNFKPQYSKQVHYELTTSHSKVQNMQRVLSGSMCGTSKDVYVNVHTLRHLLSSPENEKKIWLTLRFLQSGAPPQVPFLTFFCIFQQKSRPQDYKNLGGRYPLP